MRRFWVVLICVILLSSTGVVFAQDEKSDEETQTEQKPVYGSEVVVTATRSPFEFTKTPRSISVVPGEQIFDRLYRTTPESLKYVEGVVVQRTNFGGGAPFIRGLVGNQVLYLIDGIRVNNSTFRGGPNQYLNTIDPFFIERIEVVHGPSSVMYGSDALGGVINIITKRRTDFSRSFGGDGRVMTRFSSADREETAHMSFDLNGGKVFGMAFSGNFRTFGDIDGGGAIGIQSPYGYEEQHFGGNFDFHIGRHFVWQFHADHSNMDDVPGYAPGELLNEFEPQRRQLFYTKFMLNDLAKNLQEISLFASYQQQLEGRIKHKYGEALSKIDPFVVQTKDEDTVNTIGAGLQVVPTIGKYVAFHIGGETYMDEVSSERETENFRTDVVEKIDPQFPDGSSYTTAAGYMQMDIMPMEWWVFQPGVRYNYILPDISMEDPNLGTVEVNDPITNMSWAANTLFEFVPHHSLIAGVSTGFRAPGIDDLTKLGPEDGRYDIPNSELDPETLTQYEFGYRMTYPRYYLSAFGYYSAIEDLIIRKPSEYKGMTMIGEDVVNQNQNVGEAYIWGIEAAVKLELIKEFFTTGGTFGYTFGQNETDDEPIRRIPPMTGTWYAKLSVEPIWFETAMEAAGEQDRLSAGDIADSRIGPDGTHGFDVWHFRIGMRPTNYLEGIFAVENAFDRQYKYHGSGPWEPGRNFKAQLSFLF